MNNDWMKDFQPEAKHRMRGESFEQFELRMKSQMDIKHIDAKKNFNRELWHLTYIKRIKDEY